MTTDFSAGAAHVGGQIVPIGQAAIPILDLGILHSDATYDVADLLPAKRPAKPRMPAARVRLAAAPQVRPVAAAAPATITPELRAGRKAAAPSARRKATKA